MPAAQIVPDTIFEQAIAIADEQARASYLDRACAGDRELREEALRLVEGHFLAGSFLEAPPSAVAIHDHDATQPPAALERPGTRIGNYKLLQQIGEGGFGIVYMAEQERPVRRKVALKILKAGMDTKEIIARFESERQALALMDHPNIAKVLDGGTVDDAKDEGGRMKDGRNDEGGRMKDEGNAASSSFILHPSSLSGGRPYFVMELVRGLPITEFCDEHRLLLEERLKLFIQVCQAVQHAHQKGIIHRDIKPSNVMVTLHDDRPVPKVIDFGIAKAMSQQLTERTLFTAYGQMVGTPAYMSPEQAALSGLDIDTRSDVYSLGVLLYELITGTTPFEKERLKRVSFDEMRRIIREEEPETISMRLAKTRRVGYAHQDSAFKPASAESGGHNPTYAGHPSSFRLHPYQELDWIAAKALEKDRDRRYESASALAADVQCYFNDEPVRACPPSTMYRFKKLIRRHRVAFVSGTLVGCGVLLGVMTCTLLTIWALTLKAQAQANYRDSVAARRREQEEFSLRMKEGRAAQDRLELQQRLLTQDNRIYRRVLDELVEARKGDAGISPISPQQREELLTKLGPLKTFVPTARAKVFQAAGDAFVSSKCYSEALDAYTEGLAVSPRAAELYISRGDVYFRLKEFEKCISDYTSAVENPPLTGSLKKYLPYSRRGFAWCRVNNFAEARADFLTSYNAAPRETLAFLSAGFHGLQTIRAELSDPLKDDIQRLFAQYASEHEGSPAELTEWLEK